MFRYYYGFDIYYLVLILPAMLLGLWAQAQIGRASCRERV